MEVPRRYTRVLDLRLRIHDFFSNLLESYERHGFFASALAVSKGDSTPGEGFWSLMKQLGLVTSGRSTRALEFWSGQVRAAHEWYVANPDRDI